MSDIPPLSTKPKVGSLRDRIAAFEKPATANSSAGPAPAPRPKPGGMSWKPKLPSPPLSPAGAEPAASERKAGGMSASDAKESISKAGSLKERMAALQGKGAFGAPPPVSPKPVVEKPKWKPPPVVPPIEKDEDDQPPVESSTSVLALPVRSAEDETPAETHDEEITAEGEGHAEADPMEEERQRRAAIAARMARLGGARVGMAPMFGRPTVAKKPDFSEPTKPAVVVDGKF
jgi:myosin tail region-interacting protein MTI1